MIGYKKDKSSKSKRVKWGLASINRILIVWLALSPIALSYYLYSVNESERLAHMELDNQGSQFLSFVDNRTSQIQYAICDAFAELSHSSLLFDFASNGEPRLKRYLQDQWYLALQNYSYFSQLRYLNNDGLEVVRVDYIQERAKPYVVPERELQDKGHRNYVKYAKTLSKGEIGYFGVDLEMEQGKVLVPYKPSFRLLFALSDGDQSLGYFVANLDVNRIIDVITENEQDYKVHFIDKAGDYLLSSDKGKMFSRVLNNDGYQSLDVAQPELWKQIQQGGKSQGVFIQPEGVFLYRPMLASVWSKTSEMVLLTQFPKAKVEQKFEQYHRHILLVVAWLLFLLLVVSIGIVVLAFKYKQNSLKRIFYSLVIERGNAVVLTDLNHNIKHANEQFLELVRQDLAQVSRTNLYQLMSEGQSLLRLQSQLDKEQHWKGSIELVVSETETVMCEVEVRVINNGDSAKNHYVYSFVDITQHQHRLAEMKERSEKDMATKLWNKSKFEEMLKMQCDLTARYEDHPSSCIAIIDIDCFKQINDSFGHLIGDEVLLHISSLLQQKLRQSDVIARFGGDEFAVILQHADEEEAIAMLTRIKAGVAGWHNFPVSVSIGVAAITDSMEQSFSNADEALYHAKRNGRNAVVSHRNIRVELVS